MRPDFGRTSMPRKRSSVWNLPDLYWLPWSWRTARPQAASLANAPKQRRTPWRIGSSASKRIARTGGARHPGRYRCGLHERRRTRRCGDPLRRRPRPDLRRSQVRPEAGRTAVVVMSVPPIVSTASGMMVPSWLRGPRGDPTREGAHGAVRAMGRARASAAARGASNREVRRAWTCARLRAAVGPAPCDGLRRGRGWRREQPGRALPAPHPPSAQSGPGAAAARRAPEHDDGRGWHAQPARRARRHTACRCSASSPGGTVNLFGRDRNKG